MLDCYDELRITHAVLTILRLINNARDNNPPDSIQELLEKLRVVFTVQFENYGIDAGACFCTSYLKGVLKQFPQHRNHDKTIERIYNLIEDL